MFLFHIRFKLPQKPFRMLYRKMGQAGVSLVYPENLSITDKEVSHRRQGSPSVPPSSHVDCIHGFTWLSWFHIHFQGYNGTTVYKFPCCQLLRPYEATNLAWKGHLVCGFFQSAQKWCWWIILYLHTYDSFRLIYPEISRPTSWILMKFIGDPNISTIGWIFHPRPGRQTLGQRKEPGPVV